MKNIYHHFERNLYEKLKKRRRREKGRKRRCEREREIGSHSLSLHLAFYLSVSLSVSNRLPSVRASVRPEMTKGSWRRSSFPSSIEDAEKTQSEMTSLPVRSASAAVVVVVVVVVVAVVVVNA